MNSEDSRLPIHRRPAGLSIRVREMDCVLADIQANIQMLRREKTYLRLVREELAGRKPSKGVRHSAHFVEGAGSRLGSLGVHKTGGPLGERRLEAEPGTAQRGNDGERDKNGTCSNPWPLLPS